MKESVLVVIKPDGMIRKLQGEIIHRFAQTELELVGAKPMNPSEDLLKEHYRHIAGEKFFQEVLDYVSGKLHNGSNVWALVYYGDDAINVSRTIAGATNPELADPTTIRGSFGRITTEGVFENVVHVSSDVNEAEREIKLWFQPDELAKEIFQTKKAASTEIREWQ